MYRNTRENRRPRFQSSQNKRGHRRRRYDKVPRRPEGETNYPRGPPLLESDIRMGDERRRYLFDERGDSSTVLKLRQFKCSVDLSRNRIEGGHHDSTRSQNQTEGGLGLSYRALLLSGVLGEYRRYSLVAYNGWRRRAKPTFFKAKRENGGGARLRRGGCQLGKKRCALSSSEPRTVEKCCPIARR